MKVFLLYPDRDFNLEQPLPPGSAELVRDLELSVVLDAMAKGDKFVHEVAEHALLNSLNNPRDIRYRQDILKDCLKHPEVVNEIYSISMEPLRNKHGRWLRIFSRYPGGILSSAIKMLDFFVELLKSLKLIADWHAEKFESEGFQRFFSMIRKELDDSYLRRVEEHLEDLRFKKGVLISAELGKGNEGINYVLRKPRKEKSSWLKRVLMQRNQVYSFSLHPKDDLGAKVLRELRDRGLNKVANAVAQSADHIESFFAALRLELSFYVGCLNLASELRKLDEPYVFPRIFPPAERYHDCRELYDISLALTRGERVVGNDVVARGKELVIITGPNQGGKSTFLRSIGIAQLMTQAGMFVPASSLSVNLSNGVYTHYKREEDTSMKSGKFDEELARMSKIVDMVEPGALILFNESFSSTNEREGSEIARQILFALLDSGMKVFFVTHLYDLATTFISRYNGKTLFLRAERQAGAKRTYKLKEAKPLQTSFGEDLYREIFERDPGEKIDIGFPGKSR